MTKPTILFEVIDTLASLKMENGPNGPEQSFVPRPGVENLFRLKVCSSSSMGRFVWIKLLSCSSFAGI